jgi:hypothetical protein
MIAMEEVRLGQGPHGVLVVTCVGRPDDGPAEVLNFELRDLNLRASKDVYGGYAHSFGDLAQYFDGLAADWRGWSDVRIYESLEHDLRLEATHDGHVQIRVRLWQSADIDGWDVWANLRVDPGEELSRAARHIRAIVGSAQAGH